VSGWGILYLAGKCRRVVCPVGSFSYICFRMSRPTAHCDSVTSSSTDHIS
jgi:hypothetical protein